MLMRSLSSKILIVTHGETRGREVGTLDGLLDYARQNEPVFHRRIRLHRTGETPLALNGVGLVLFWLGDPLKQLYPDCFDEALDIQKTAESLGIHVINPPEALSRTAKSIQAAIWRANGIVCADVRRANSEAHLREVAEELGYPCILRSDLSHTQATMEVITSPEQLTGGLQRAAPAPALVEVKDIRAAHLKSGTPGLNAQFHHKARAIVACGEVKSVHLFHGKDIVVGSCTSLFAREARPRRELARQFGFRRRFLKTLLAKDLDYYNAPTAHAGEIVRAVHALGLDFAAVDYSFLPDGSLFFWEANPYFSLPPGRLSVMADARQAPRRVRKTYAWITARLKHAIDAANVETAEMTA